MDIAEVTLRLGGRLAERLRRDPAERARYEAFLELAAAARTSAQVEQAARLFTAPPAERQRLLTEMSDGAFGSDPTLALRDGDAAWAIAVWRARSAVRHEGRAAAVVQAPRIPLVPLGASALLLLMLGGGAMALWYSAIPQEPAFTSTAAEDRAGHPPVSLKPPGPGVVASDHATAGPEGDPAPRPVPSAPHTSPPAVRTGAPPPSPAPAAGPAGPAGPSLADAFAPSAASGASRTGMEAPPDLPEATAPGLVAPAVGSPAETDGGPEPPRAGAVGVFGGVGATGRAPPGPGRGASASRPAAAAGRAARLVVAEVRGAGGERGGRGGAGRAGAAGGDALRSRQGRGGGAVRAGAGLGGRSGGGGWARAR
jgi:hypothetical protein